MDFKFVIWVILSHFLVTSINIIHISISILSHTCPDRVNSLSLGYFGITGKWLPVGVFVGNLVGLFVGDLLGLFGHF